MSYIVTVTAVHHPTKLQYPPVELIFGDFAPALLEDSFGFIRDKPSRKCSEKHFYAGTLFNTNDTLSLL